jgi:hypothetical protein
VSLSPNNDKAPWRIDYYFKIRQNAPRPLAGTATSASANLTSQASMFVTPGLNGNKANEIPELPPRYTLPLSSTSALLPTSN